MSDTFFGFEYCVMALLAGTLAFLLYKMKEACAQAKENWKDVVEGLSSEDEKPEPKPKIFNAPQMERSFHGRQFNIPVLKGRISPHIILTKEYVNLETGGRFTDMTMVRCPPTPK